MSVTSWITQAKEVTKKLSGLMYVPSEEFRASDDSKIEDGPANCENALDAQGSESSNSPQFSSWESAPQLGSMLLNDNAVGTAKKVASSFLSFAKEASAKATATAEGTAKLLQNVVAEKTIIGDLDKEREKFDRAVNANKLPRGTLPWSDLPEQWIARKHILALSLDSRNFLRDPPTETGFNLNYTRVQAIAALMLEEDPNLRKVRYQLVPKHLSEERFWKNYLYRVSLVRQSALFGSENEGSVCSKNTNQQDKFAAEIINDDRGEARATTKEFVGIFNKNELANQQNEKATKAEEDWEKELVNDFDDYEVINDKTDPNWEEIEKCIDSV